VSTNFTIGALLTCRRHARGVACVQRKRKREAEASLLNTGAGKESRTLDLNLGKVALYQLSYSRILLRYRRYRQSASARLKL
jgi:hypothetical protein